MYGKIEDGILKFAPNKLYGDGVVVYNPPFDMYLSQGWKLVQYTEEPSDAPSGYYYKSGWDEEENIIIQTWELSPLPEDISGEEAFNIIFGEEE